MKLRSLFKITFLCLLPSIALLFIARSYWRPLAERFLANTEALTAIRDSEVPRRLAWTGIWIALALYLLAAVNHLLSPELARRRQTKELPALLRDLIRYGLFVFAAAIVLRTIWGEDVAPLLGALGIGGVVLGFALQETLSNFFAGLALLAEQPFSQGDWIRIGDRVEGVVEHITWRATKIRTRDNDYQIFPNSTVAKEVIVNFRMPSRVHAIRLHIGTSYDDAPDKVKKTLHEILASVPEVLRSPEPIIYVKEYAASSINFEIKCYIEDYDRRPVIEDKIMHRMWYAFRRAGIEIPFPIQTVFEHKMPYTEPAARKGEINLERVLGLVPIFTALSPEELNRLASAAKVVDFGSGEPVIHQGDSGDTLYAIVMGSAQVAVRGDDGNERTVAKLAQGEVFGEMSLLTGDPRTASVYADDGLVLCAVSKDALLPVLDANPAMAEKMAEIVTLRKQGLDRVQAEATMNAARRTEVQAATRNLLGRIRSFFRLK
jgi:small-conductance mechanosensitive channel/CRP-like cAMP-binding protein